MRQKLEFVSKVIGLLTVSGGIVSAISIAYIILFLAGDYTQLLQLNFNDSFGMNKDLNDAFYAILRVERQVYFKILILSLLPIPFGLYLMKSNNIFVDFCYPKEGDDSNSELFDPHFAEIAEEDDINIGDYSYGDGIGYGRCPECKADLIRRKVEHGEHAGKYLISCSNFPQCKRIFPYREQQAEAEQPFRL
jgi:hypothetical protein